MLEFLGVSKRFHGAATRALDDVSFSVEKGRICGLLGHNGAGKSTALGILLGLVYPDAGEVRIAGISVQNQRERAVAKVGAIFESPAFYDYLSGWRNLKVLTAYSGGVDEALMRETIEWVGLSARIHDPVGKYSHGMRQRLALAQALLPRPEMLVLDEPTDGLDPEGIVEFRRQLLELREVMNITVLFSSHLLSEVEQVCDEVVILRSGKKVYEGAVSASLLGQTLYRIEAKDQEILDRIVQSFRGEKHGDRYAFPVECNPSELLAAFVKEGSGITCFAPEPPSLESLYLQAGREQKGGTA